jgi:hypothetical protein
MSEDLDQMSTGGLEGYLGRECGTTGDSGKQYQLRKIFDVIGTPTTEEVQQLAACGGDYRRKIESALQTIRHCERIDFEAVFHQTNVTQPGLVDLIGRLLVLNPLERISAEAGLQLPLFERTAMEWASENHGSELHTFEQHTIKTDFEAVEDLGQLKQLLIGEVSLYNAERVFALDFEEDLQVGDAFLMGR